METGTIIAIIALIVSTAFSAWNANRLSKSDAISRSEQSTAMQVSMGQLQITTAGIKESVENISKHTEKNTVEIAVITKSNDALHTRVDNQQDKIDRIIDAQNKLSENLNFVNNRVTNCEVRVSALERSRDEK